MATAVLIGTACMDAAAPPLPDNAVQFAPPPVYAHWWRMTEECSGMQRPLSRVAWYVVPGVSKVSTGEGEGAAYWSRNGNRIVLAGAAQFEGPMVRHEMLHALRQAAGHPRATFLKTCAGVVNCFPHCVTDAGPHNLDWTTPRVPATALDVSISLDPPTPSVTTRGGFFNVVVLARNPAPYPVIVSLSGTGSPFGWSTFGVDVGSPQLFVQDRAMSFDEAAGYFAAGEAKRHVFDLRIRTAPGEPGLAPGRYEVRGSFGGRWVMGPTIEIEP